MTASFSTAMSVFQFFILLLISSMFPEPSDSLKLKLFHRSSLESPGYLNNLTAHQKITTFFNQSRTRAQVLNHRAFPTRKTMQSNEDELERPSIIPFDIGGVNGYSYAVKIGIGTFPGQQPSYNEYYLTLDTASSLSWLQCEPCEQRGNHCYPQNDPLFSNVDSDTYTPLMVKDEKNKICKGTLIPHNPELCFYEIEYQDESKSIGQVAKEKFTFESDIPGVPAIANIIFGCGFNQVGFEATGQPAKISGIMGMNLGPYSLRTQLDPDDIDPDGLSFSYCFQNILLDENHHQLQPGNTYLRMGDDIEEDRSSYLSTPLIGPPPGTDNSAEQYYIKVEDIMINNNRLMIDPSAFKATVVDSGTPISQLTGPAYEALENGLKAMFDTNPNYKKTFLPDVDGYCYDMVVPEGYENLPTIQLMLDEDSIYEIKPEQGFLVAQDENNVNFFCLMILPTADDINILGAFQQINKRIIFDTNDEEGENKFLFKNEDCANNP